MLFKTTPTHQISSVRIVFFSHYYPPEGNAPASRTSEHCARWIGREGVDKITVITCAPNVPDGKVYQGYRNRLWPQRETIDGVEVLRVWTYIRERPGKRDLILNYLSYLFSATFAYLFFARRPHVVVATTPQFFCGIAGVVASWLKWCPLVLEVRDIWPESIVQVGAIKRGLVIRTLEWLEKKMYRSANHIVAVGPGYRDDIVAKVNVKDRISIVTNGVAADQFVPQNDAPDFSEKYDLGDRFVCSYIGTVGMAHGLDVVVRAAATLKQAQRSDIVFLIVGGGSTLDQLRAQVNERGLDDMIKLTGRLDKQEMPNALAASDVCLVHLSKTDLFQHVIPSKIFETMAMERPIIMGVKGRARDIVLEGNAGVAMEPESDEELVQLLENLSADRSATKGMGANGRQFVLRYFNRDTLADDMLTIIKKTAAKETFVLEERSWNQDSVSDEAAMDESESVVSGSISQ